MKKFAAITMLAAVMTVGVPQANAGILMADFAANQETKTTVTNTGKNNQVGQQVSVIKSMILVLEGILMGD
jgi:hypothetical protein